MSVMDLAIFGTVGTGSGARTTSGPGAAGVLAARSAGRNGNAPTDPSRRVAHPPLCHDFATELPVPGRTRSAAVPRTGGRRPSDGFVRDHVWHDRGVLAHRKAARRHTVACRPQLRPRGGAPPRPR